MLAKSSIQSATKSCLQTKVGGLFRQLNFTGRIKQNTPYNKCSHIPKLKRANSFNYVKIKDIQRVKQDNKEHGSFKVLTKTCSFFMKQAWQDFKADYSLFKQIKSIPQNERTTTQKLLYHRIKIDLIKFGPALCIFNVPFGFPLFYLYVTFFPRLIPSWMMIDSLNDKILSLKLQRKTTSWKYYLDNFKENVRIPYLKQAIFKQNQSLQDLRKISCICYGDYMDGTQYISEKIGYNFPQGFISPKLSIFLLKFQLKNQLQNDYQFQGQLNSMPKFQDRVFFKLSKQISK